MSTIAVSGGRRLNGEVQVAGAKNAVLKMMAASLLTNDEVILSNVPRISDVRAMAALLASVGVSVERPESSPHTLVLRADNVSPAPFDLDVFKRIRASFMLMAPLLARCGKVSVPDPGGDRIGHRPVDRLVEGLKGFGVQLSYDDGQYHAECARLRGCRYEFEKRSHMGTEHQLLAAVLAEGDSEIHNAAQEPEVDDLIAMLNSMGARIHRTEPSVIRVQGVRRLHGTQHTVMADRIEAGTFATMAAATDGDIYMRGASPRHTQALLHKLTESGCVVEPDPGGVRVRRGKRLSAVNVTTSPHPGFMTDWQAPFGVLMTQAEGESTIHETIFPNRLEYTHQLARMGANIELFNPEVPDGGYDWNPADDSPGYKHAARIRGRTRLRASELEIEDIRAGATLIIAALCAEGTSEISGVEHVARGYEQFAERLTALGADILVRLPAEAAIGLHPAAQVHP